MQSTKQMIGKVNKKDLVRTITDLSYFFNQYRKRNLSNRVSSGTNSSHQYRISDIYATKYHILRP